MTSLESTQVVSSSSAAGGATQGGGERAKTRVWMVRAGSGGSLLDLFLKNGVAAIGWDEVGDLAGVRGREEVRERVDRAYPAETRGNRASAAGMIARFALEIRPDELVVTYDPGRRQYHLGRVAGAYVHRPDLDAGHPHTLPVRWEWELSRDSFGAQARNTLGAIQTLFEIQGVARDEMLALLERPADAPVSPPAEEAGAQQEEEQLEEVRRDAAARAEELIKDRLQQLSWQDMQELVAGILRALGYRTTVSPAGPDQGKDIVASPDGLGLQAPRIRVEVKHRKGTMGANDIRSFVGGLHGVDSGLYVSTGGFTRDAHYEADRSKIPLTLVTLDRLVDLVVQHYDNFDADARALIPLVRVYWPAS